MSHAEEIESLVATLAAQVSRASKGQDVRARTQAVRMLTEMVGAIVLANAVADANPALSEEILEATGRSG